MPMPGARPSGKGSKIRDIIGQLYQFTFLGPSDYPDLKSV